ncbi:MAG: VWA domain-containing protein [Oscillospiraceae bacterium]|nr:VWA domain-containing protein [Oscillospiraceae bacterium]
MIRTLFPFTAVLGQEKIKNALIWNLINPRIGGVLISGEKGTAKSTLVRGVAELGDTKIIELPLNVTEDRLVGAIDLKQALQNGRRELEAGILRDADGNVLYVDEVNLLSDHIVNALLEVAASGVNTVEREGISCSHPSRFILIGSMNQEEGKLRSQFLDRFGLYVEVEGEKDLSMRVEIMKRRVAFETNPLRFIKDCADETRDLTARINAAQTRLPAVEVTSNAHRFAAMLAHGVHSAGHRGELALIETAKAIAALDGRGMLNIDDIKQAAEYALPHRTQEPPQDDFCQEPPEEALPEEDVSPPEQEQNQAQDQAQDENPPPEAQPPPDTTPPEMDNADQADGADNEDEDDIQEAGEAFIIPRWTDAHVTRQINKGSGRRNLVRSGTNQGRYVNHRMAGSERVSDLAFDATVRAAAPFQSIRDKAGRALAIERDDLRVKIREKRTGGSILFVVDASASMGANKRMKEVKAAILSMLNVSYQKRDKVGLIAFRKDSAELLLGITRSVDLAQKKLSQLPTGGKTPLSQGLDLAYEVLMGLKIKDPDAVPTLVLISDGRASGKKAPGSNPFGEALKSAERIGNQGINTIILDTENDFIKFRLCEKLNEKLRGTLLTMEDMKADGIVEAITAIRRTT